jgi:NadR type nicotinamide-nucleotide adenylyltransferase
VIEASGVGKPRRVVLIGPESTGKTWLAEALAGHHAVPWSPEYARAYVEGLTRPLSYADVDAIGRGQVEGEDAARKRAHARGAALVIHDTDLVSTMVYSRHYYGDCPEWIARAARERVGDLYLLHHVDVEWVADGHQREQPERREELLERFRETLQEIGARMADVRGDWDERRRRAEEAIAELGDETGDRVGA